MDRCETYTLQLAVRARFIIIIKRDTTQHSHPYALIPAAHTNRGRASLSTPPHSNAPSPPPRPVRLVQTKKTAASSHSHLSLREVRSGCRRMHPTSR